MCVFLQVIKEVNKDPSLIADIRDTSKQRLRGVIQLNRAHELGKVTLCPPPRPDSGSLSATEDRLSASARGASPIGRLAVWM